VLKHINLVNSNLKCLFLPSLEEKKTLKKSSSTAIVQNWTPRRRRTQEVCGSGQPTINQTWNQLRINLAFCVQSFGLWSCPGIQQHCVSHAYISRRTDSGCHPFIAGIHNQETAEISTAQ
jgi:hypothetical protein